MTVIVIAIINLIAYGINSISVIKWIWGTRVSSKREITGIVTITILLEVLPFCVFHFASYRNDGMVLPMSIYSVIRYFKVRNNYDDSLIYTASS